MSQIRTAIEENRYQSFHDDFMNRYAHDRKM